MRSKLRNATKSMLGHLAGRIQMKTLIQLSRQQLFFPFYHTVSEKYLPHISNLYPVRNTKMFSDDLDYLLQHFKPVAIEDVIQHINGKKMINVPSFHLSFDDGLAEINDIIAPVLISKGIPATIFINPSFAGNKDLFYRYKLSLLLDRLNYNSISAAQRKRCAEIVGCKTTATSDLNKLLFSINYLHKNDLDTIANVLEVDFKEYLSTYKPYLEINQIKDLKTKGFTIGSHSFDHPQYKLIAQEAQIRQTIDSVKIVKELFNVDYALFSFPFTDEGVSRKFFDLIFHESSDKIDLSFGISGLKHDYSPRHIHRFSMDGTAKNAKHLFHTEYLYYLVKQAFGKNKIARV